MGMTMARGECLPLSGTLPLLPVADALGELGGRDGGGLLDAALDAAPGFARDEIERLLGRVGGGGDPAGPAVPGRGGRAGHGAGRGPGITAGD
jgi:hypothetical protein